MSVSCASLLMLGVIHVHWGSASFCRSSAAKRTESASGVTGGAGRLTKVVEVAHALEAGGGLYDRLEVHESIMATDLWVLVSAQERSRARADWTDVVRVVGTSLLVVVVRGVVNILLDHENLSELSSWALSAEQGGRLP